MPIDSKLLSYPMLIPLDELLLANGFSVVRHKSTARNPVLENDNIRIVISKYPNGHYLYFNANDSNDRGNIYNLCRNHSLNINTLLETYFNTPHIDKSYCIKDSALKAQDRSIAREFLALPQYNPNTDNLLQKRSLGLETIEDFCHSIRVDSRNNTLFPQYELTESNTLFICGYTMKLKNPIYTDKNGIRFSKPLKSICKGKKGLEILLPKDKSANSIIISESALDSMSLYELGNFKDCIIVGTGGNTNMEHLANALRNIKQHRDIKDIYLGFDNDKMGESFRDSTLAIAQQLNLNAFNFTPCSKDFNDDLRLIKILNIDKSQIFINQRFYDTDKLKDAINHAADELIYNYRHSKLTSERQDILKRLRKVDSMIKLDKSVVEKFNSYKYKDKRIRDLGLWNTF